jgi:hypothetical protein
MRVRVRQNYENPRRGLALVKGEVFDAPDALAVKLLACGIAEPAPAPEPETAEKRKPAKTQAKRTGKTITKKDFFGEEA